MFREILLLCIISPPGLDITYEFEQLDGTVTYSLDTLIVLIYLLRFYYGLKLFKQYSSWTDQAAVNFGQRYNVIVDEIWALKCVMKHDATKVMCFLLVFSIFVFGLALRTTEQPWPESDFKYIWNGWWIIAVSMTTIGYGEIVPTTHLGRFVTTAACIWGAFLLSIFVVALIEGVVMEDDEEYGYSKVHEKLFIRGKLRKYAIKFIQRWTRLTLSRRQNKLMRTRLRQSLTAYTATKRFKLQRHIHTVRSEMKVEEAIEKWDETAPKMKLMVDDLKRANRQVPDFQDKTWEYYGSVIQSNNIQLEIKNSIMRTYSVFQQLKRGRAKKLSDISEVRLSGVKKTKPHDEMSWNHRRRKTAMMKRSSIQAIKKNSKQTTVIVSPAKVLEIERANTQPTAMVWSTEPAPVGKKSKKLYSPIDSIQSDNEQEVTFREVEMEPPNTEEGTEPSKRDAESVDTISETESEHSNGHSEGENSNGQSESNQQSD